LEYVNSGYQKYSVNLPANMAGEFIISTTPFSVVTLNGEQVDLSFGYIRLDPGLNDIEVRINSF